MSLVLAGILAKKGWRSSPSLLWRHCTRNPCSPELVVASHFPMLLPHWCSTPFLGTIYGGMVLRLRSLCACALCFLGGHHLLRAFLLVWMANIHFCALAAIVVSESVVIWNLGVVFILPVGIVFPRSSLGIKVASNRKRSSIAYAFMALYAPWAPSLPAPSLPVILSDSPRKAMGCLRQSRME